MNEWISLFDESVARRKNSEKSSHEKIGNEKFAKCNWLADAPVLRSERRIRETNWKCINQTHQVGNWLNEKRGKPISHKTRMHRVPMSRRKCFILSRLRNSIRTMHKNEWSIFVVTKWEVQKNQRNLVINFN